MGFCYLSRHTDRKDVEEPCLAVQRHFHVSPFRKDHITAAVAKTVAATAASAAAAAAAATTTFSVSDTTDDWAKEASEVRCLQFYTHF